MSASDSRQDNDAALVPSDSDQNRDQATGHSHGTNTMMGRFGRFVVRYPLPVMVGILLAALVMAAVGMSKFSINTDPPQGRSAYAMDTGT